MSAQRSKRPGGPSRPSTQPPQAEHRRGRSPLLLYVAGLVVVLLVGALLIYGGRALRGLLTPSPSKRVTTTTSTPAPSKVTTPSAAASVPPLPASAAAGSAAAMKAAALRYPNPPGVTPQTISRAVTSRNIVALTFDDGPPIDMRILSLLESKNVKCTTFLTGRTVKAQPAFVKRLAADGFEIANHTWDQKVLTSLTDAEIRTQISDCQNRISAITRDQAPYMRPPGGISDARVERIAASMGFRVVLWDRSSGDTSKGATAESIFRNVMDGLKPGDIIQYHWGGTYAYDALPRILAEMRRRGITPVTVSELLKYSSTSAGVTAQQGAGGAGVRPPTAEELAEAGAATGTAAARARAAAEK